MTSNHRKSEVKQQPSPYFYFFRNLWRNAYRPVVVCYSLITRNAKLAALPQIPPSPVRPVPFYPVYSPLPRAVTQLRPGWPAAKVEESRCFRASASIVLGIAITMAALFPLRAPLGHWLCLRRLRNSHSDFQVQISWYSLLLAVILDWSINRCTNLVTYSVLLLSKCFDFRVYQSTFQ